MQRTNTHLPFLDHIRCFAILFVFLFHCLGVSYGYDQLPWNGWVRDWNVPGSFLALLPTTFGWTGVSIFFVVSGFCIHLSHQRSRQKDWGTFFTRRFFRIYPPYLVALLIFSFVYPWQTVQLESPYRVAQFLSHVVLLHNLDSRSFMAINPSFWSIALEVQLYALYPILLLMTRKLSWKKTLWILAIVEIAIRTASGIHHTQHGEYLPRWFISGPISHWFSWAIGAAAAEAFLKYEALPFQRVPLWIFPTLTVGTAFVHPLEPFSFMFAALATVSVIAALLKRSDETPTRQPGMFHRQIAFLGTISYSIYLLHQPIIMLVPVYLAKLGMHLSPIATVGVCYLMLVPTLALSVGFYRIIELPSIAAGKWFLQRCKDLRAKLQTPPAMAEAD